MVGVAGGLAHTQRALSKSRSTSTSRVDPKNDPDFDRLDGTGKSGKRVNVIDWENNLEIHVYPAGSLIGLGLKIDDTAAKKVMVISYRFDTQPKEPLIRRALLTMPLREGFKAYRDPSATDYDKIIVTQNSLSGEMLAYSLEKPPTQNYPDGHPASRAVASQPSSESRQVSPGAESKYLGDESGEIPSYYRDRQAETQMLRR